MSDMGSTDEQWFMWELVRTIHSPRILRSPEYLGWVTFLRAMHEEHGLELNIEYNIISSVDGVRELLRAGASLGQVRAGAMLAFGPLWNNGDYL